MTARRGARRVLLFAIALILVAVGGAYRIQKRLLHEQSPQKPTALALDLNASAQDWVHTTSRPDGRPLLWARAKDFRQIKQSGLIELAGVELHLFHEDGSEYDLVKSAKAEFRPAEKILYSEGEVEITLAVPAQGTVPAGRLVSIRSSGVTFDTGSGKATTDKPADFVFENGDGRCVGASYDPAAKELLMYSQVQLNWRSQGPKPRSMKIETERLSYKESMAAVILFPWARLTDGAATIQAGDTYVTLHEGTIQRVEAKMANGTAEYPAQHLEYGADHMFVDFTPEGLIQNVVGEPNARLTSTTPSSKTAVTTNRIDLDFDTGSSESVLKRALARGSSVVESTPAASAEDVRVLRSETIETTMRPGGKEIERVQTHAPGRIELRPRAAGHRRRQMDGERITIEYGPENRMRTFQAVNVATRTDPLPGTKNAAPAETWSKGLLANFDPATGHMTRMEQWQDFRYRQGERRASAGYATFDPEPDTMKLRDAARVWEPDGSTSADAIQLDQKTGRFTADGHVSSSRLPESQNPGQSSWQGMLGGGKEPLEALADHMTSENRNTLIQYRGHAVLWQGANRIQGDQVVIDRSRRRLTAQGNVSTQLVDDSAPGKAAQLTLVKAAELVYTDADRQMIYTGGVVLNRPDMNITSARLRALLAEPDAESRIERLYADGKVKIVQTLPGRTRTGTGEHAEYIAIEDRVVLRGGNPQFEDTRSGVTRGAELTYFTRDDTLLVNGAPAARGTSRIPRK